MTHNIFQAELSEAFNPDFVEVERVLDVAQDDSDGSVIYILILIFECPEYLPTYLPTYWFYYFLNIFLVKNLWQVRMWCSFDANLFLCSDVTNLWKTCCTVYQYCINENEVIEIWCFDYLLDDIISYDGYLNMLKCMLWSQHWNFFLIDYTIEYIVCRYIVELFTLLSYMINGVISTIKI